MNQLKERIKISKKYLIIMGIAVLIIIAWIIYISQFNHQKAEATSETETVELTRGSIRETISGSGTIEAISRKEIASECTGTINTIYVSEGQEVEKGDLLMTFDNDSYDSSVKSAELNLQQAKAELASLNRDKANLKIYAPSSGMLGSSLPALGDNLGKGAAFSAITDKTHMQTQASFNLNSSSSISKGQKASLFIADYLQSIEGTVTNVSSVEYQGGQKISNVLISIDNPGRLAEGTGVTVSIQTTGGTLSAAENAALQWPSASTVQVKTAGAIKHIYVTADEWVEKGQLLAELESSDLEEQISNQIISIQKQELSLDQQRNELEKRTLYAPIAGTVVDVSVTEGEEVTENKAALISISCLSTLQVTIPVDELDILKVEKGQKAIISSSAISDQIFTARVADIAAEGSSNSGVSTFDVLLQLDNPGALKAGMNVNAEIIVVSKQDVLVLPMAAIKEQAGKKWVQLQAGNGQKSLREVEIGLITGTQAEIISGVKEGDIVIYDHPAAAASSHDSSANQSPPPGVMMGPGAGGPGRMR